MSRVITFSSHNFALPPITTAQNLLLMVYELLVEIWWCYKTSIFLAHGLFMTFFLLPAYAFSNIKLHFHIQLNQEKKLRLKDIKLA